MLGACYFRSTEGRLKSVKNKSGLFPGFQFSLLSTYLGVCTLHAVHMRRLLRCIEDAVKIEGNCRVLGVSQNFLRLRRALPAAQLTRYRASAGPGNAARRAGPRAGAVQKKFQFFCDVSIFSKIALNQL